MEIFQQFFIEVQSASVEVTTGLQLNFSSLQGHFVYSAHVCETVFPQLNSLKLIEM